MPHNHAQRLACCLASLALAATAVAAGPSRGFGGDQRATGVRGFDDSPASSNAAKGKANAKALEWAREFLKDNDRNKDGALTVAETRSWSKIVPFDHDNNKRISLQELVAYSTGKPLRKRTALAAGGERDKEGRRSQRLWTATDKLPEGLPSWFSDKDGNRDGQVAMHEYSRTWSASTVRRFLGLDKNDDGLITPDEALKKR